MKNVDYSHDISNNFLDYLLLFCQKIGVSTYMFEQIQSLKNAQIHRKNDIWKEWF
jgi:hypothetical protein